MTMMMMVMMYRSREPREGRPQEKRKTSTVSLFCGYNRPIWRTAEPVKSKLPKDTAMAIAQYQRHHKWHESD